MKTYSDSAHNIVLHGGISKLFGKKNCCTQGTCHYRKDQDHIAILLKALGGAICVPMDIFLVVFFSSPEPKAPGELII